jgi:hypothetical protein
MGQVVKKMRPHGFEGVEERLLSLAPAVVAMPRSMLRPRLVALSYLRIKLSIERRLVLAGGALKPLGPLDANLPTRIRVTVSGADG